MLATTMRPARRAPGRSEVEEHLTPADVAERMGVARETVLRAVRRGIATRGAEGIWPVRRLGRRNLLPAGAVNRWLEALTP
jgi:hypothetical protein